MVKEYYNRYVEETHSRKIAQKDISVIGFQDDDENYRILLIVPESEELYYGVTYIKAIDKLYSYTYKKVGKRINGKKNNIRRLYERSNY